MDKKMLSLTYEQFNTLKKDIYYLADYFFNQEEIEKLSVRQLAKRWDIGRFRLMAIKSRLATNQPVTSQRPTRKAKEKQIDNTSHQPVTSQLPTNDQPVKEVDPEDILHRFPDSDSEILLSKRHMYLLKHRFSKSQIYYLADQIQRWGKVAERKDHYKVFLTFDQNHLRRGEKWVEDGINGPMYYDLNVCKKMGY